MSDPQQIPPPGFVAVEVHASHLCGLYCPKCQKHFLGHTIQQHQCIEPDPTGQDRGQGEGGVMPAITDHGVTELVQSAPQPPGQGEGGTLAKHQPCGCIICTCEHETQCQGCGAEHCGTHPLGAIPNPVYEAEPKSLQAAATQAIDAMRQTQRLFDLPDGHLLVSAERALDAALRAIEDAEPVSNTDTLPAQQSAVEWVEERIKIESAPEGSIEYIDSDDARELARRCDKAEAQVKRYDEYHSKLIVENESLRAQLAAAEKDKQYWMESASNATCAAGKAIEERNELRAQLALEQDNARQSREEIEALKGDVAAIAENQGEWMRRAMAFEDKIAAAQADAASWKSHAEKLQAALDRAHQAAEAHQVDYLQRISAVKEELARLRKGITEIKTGTRIGWFMTDLGAKCEKLLNQ